MNSEQFLWEELRNVKMALKETLRYDYGPDPVQDYFVECDRRLARLEADIPLTAPQNLWQQFEELWSISFWISLIERSRLGEFSWPFAERIREIARPLLAEQNLGGTVNPIVHFIAEGSVYQIDYEAAVSPATGQSFAIVAFPRSLKHHVLLHVIFGHELGHAAQNTALNAPILLSEVQEPLTAQGKMADVASITAWLRDNNAPDAIKAQVATFGPDPIFSDEALESWLQELICDLFGLLLFGPSFIAAHRAMIRYSERNPYDLGPTHPPYAVRQRMLVQGMRLLDWHQPSNALNAQLQDAERRALEYVMDDQYSDWATLFTDDQLRRAIDGVLQCLTARGGFQYERPSAEVLSELLRKLIDKMPADFDQH
jgi:hypothetical protein